MASGTLHARPNRVAGRVWRFGECEFDELRHELRVKGTPVEMESKPLEVLHQLLQYPGEVLTKEELLQGVWPGLTVVDGSLTTAVSKLRKALGEDQIVVTVPRVGYRMGVPVETRETVPLGKPRRTWVVVGVIASTIGLLTIAGFAMLRYRRTGTAVSSPNTVAVLPFQNVGSDASMDYLRFALADEITTSLNRMRPLTVRPFANASRYSDGNLDMQAIGRELGAKDIVMGRYLRLGDQLQVTMEAVDVADNRLLWRDTFNVPGKDLLAMQAQIAGTARGRLAPALGATTLERNYWAPAKNAEAYELYLRSIPVSFDPIPNKQGEAMLERAVQLEPAYPAAWNSLSLRYYADSRWGGGGEAMLDRADAASERALALDPDFLDAASELAVHHTERGELVRSYRTAIELIKRRPDTGLYHHTLSYVLRYGGDLEEAGRQCDTATFLDTVVMYGSCSTTFMELGNYRRAMEFIRKDLSSEWSKAHAIEILLRQGKEKEALQIGAPKVPQWTSYQMLMACVQHATGPEVGKLAAIVRADADPEVNYLFAGHLSYCGEICASLVMLQKAIAGGYCSYPAMDSDPLFANVRKTAGYWPVRESGKICHDKFLKTRPAADD